MKANEIQVGKFYRAKVSNNLTTVRVDQVTDAPTYQTGSRTGVRTIYEVTNMRTNRKLTFRSAAKFRYETDSAGKPMGPIKQKATGNLTDFQNGGRLHQREAKPEPELASGYSGRCDCYKGHNSSSGRCQQRDVTDPTAKSPDDACFCESCRVNCYPDIVANRLKSAQ